MTALTNIDMEWTQSGMQFLTWKEGSLKKNAMYIVPVSGTILCAKC